MKVLARLWRNSITTTFLAGLALLLPVVLTVLIVAWFIDMLRAVVGPETVLGELLTTGGTTIIGEGYDTLSFFLGALIALLGIWILGLIARSAAKKSIERTIDWIFAKLPIIRAIYNPVSRVVRLATDKNTGDFSGMTVVSCRFGGKHGADVLALLANQDTFYIGGEPRKMIYLPTAPVPMTGGLVLVPEDSVVPVPQLKVDDLLRIYFSLGALAPDKLPKELQPSGEAPGEAPKVPLVDPSTVKLPSQSEAAE